MTPARLVEPTTPDALKTCVADLAAILDSGEVNVAKKDTGGPRPDAQRHADPTR